MREGDSALELDSNMRAPLSPVGKRAPQGPAQLLARLFGETANPLQLREEGFWADIACQRGIV